MAVDLDHSFTMSGSTDENFAKVTDLVQLVPCVEGGSVLEKTGEDAVRAEIVVRMGAMSLKFTGTVEITEKDADTHRALMTVKSREAGGQGHANATAEFNLADGGGTLHTHAQITGKAASMGEGVVQGVLDALIQDFTGKISRL
jgi:carbon monoxide dehydrogenase subunit G